MTHRGGGQHKWTADEILEMGRGFQHSSVLAAGADLDVFRLLYEQPRSAGRLAEEIGANPRATTVLLDCLAAMGLLCKDGERYHLADGIAELLVKPGAPGVLAMTRHMGSCARRWARLSEVVMTGRSPGREPGAKGPKRDLESFILAMEEISAPVADKVVADLGPPRFEHMLDLGGGPGTWTMAFLRACPSGRATLVDLPDVVPISRRRLEEEGFGDRAAAVVRDLDEDELPGGADLAFAGAIIHQYDRAENREFYRKIHRALLPGGTLLIRDVFMDEGRTRPLAGALFAINMLTACDGGTYTFAEMEEDLLEAGFEKVELARRDPGMNGIIRARRP